MWFQFPTGQDAISVERQMFTSEWKNEEGVHFFRAPGHFSGKLTKEGGCKLLIAPPLGVPKDLPDMPAIQMPQADGADEKLLSLQASLSDERSTSSSLRAELAAKLHENDSLKLQVHELSERINELEEKISDDDDSGLITLPKKGR